MERFVSVTARAQRKLERYGRFAEPALKRVRAKARDPEVRVRIDWLLKQKGKQP